MSEELVTTLHKVKRLPSSVNGNPRFTLFCSTGVYKTKSDAMCNYAISDGMRDEVVLIGLEYGEVNQFEVLRRE